MTYIRTGDGWMYLTVIMELIHRNVVGWSMGKTLGTTETIIPAWKMAVRSNNITDRLIFHSDRGLQYASYEFADILKEHNGIVVQSMSRKGNCWDNAVAESFFKSFKFEWVYHQNMASDPKRNYRYSSGQRPGTIKGEYTLHWTIKQ